VFVRLLRVILRGLSAFPQFLVQVWLDVSIWQNIWVPIRSCSFLLSSMRSISLTAHIDSWYANLFCAVSLFIFYIINIYWMEMIPDTRLRYPRGVGSLLLPLCCRFVVGGGAVVLMIVNAWFQGFVLVPFRGVVQATPYQHQPGFYLAWQCLSTIFSLMIYNPNDTNEMANSIEKGCPSSTGEVNPPSTYHYPIFTPNHGKN
jgi:hypothetical protein